MIWEDKKYEDELIEENVEYVVGLYDLYQNDKEIEKMLKQKGLSSYVIMHVLNRIKQPAYEKRVRQAKRLIWAGSLLFTVLFLIYLIIRLSGFSLTGSATDQGRELDGMVNFIFGFYKTIYL